MHEMGIALEIIDIASTSIPAEMKHCRVERVNIQVGKLSAVVPASLRFCFDVAAKETPLAGAVLVIDEIPIRAECRTCGHLWTIEGPAFTCRACRSGNIEMLSGRELNITSIEIQEEE